MDGLFISPVWILPGPWKAAWAACCKSSADFAPVPSRQVSTFVLKTQKRRTWHKFKQNCHQLVSLEQLNIFRYIDSDHSILKQSPSLEKKTRAGLRHQFVHFNKGSMPIRKWRTQETNNYIKLVKWTCRPQGSTKSKVGNNVEGVLGPEATEVKNVFEPGLYLAIQNWHELNN